MPTLHHQRYDQLIIYGLVCLALIGAIAAVSLDQIWLSLVVPSVIIGGYMVLYNIRLLYGALFMMDLDLCIIRRRLDHRSEVWTCEDVVHTTDVRLALLLDYRSE